jgi:GxxExxY protein
MNMNILTESDPRTYAIIGAAMEVHRQLGCGFLEPIYQEAFALELVNRKIPFTSELRFRISYKAQQLEKYY